MRVRSTLPVEGGRRASRAYGRSPVVPLHGWRAYTLPFPWMTSDMPPRGFLLPGPRKPAAAAIAGRRRGGLQPVHEKTEKGLKSVESSC